MALVNVLSNILSESATPYDPELDCTPYFADPLLAGDSLYVPVRRDENANIIPYVVRRLDLPHHAVIACESAHTRITAGSVGGWIIDIEGGRWGTRISGGTWGGENTFGVLRHRVGPGGALESSCFDRMWINGADRGFQIGSGAYNRWLGCSLRNLSKYGILVITPEDSGYFTANHVDGCKFRDVGLGVYLSLTTHPRQKLCNTISRSAFENYSLPSPLGGVRVRGFTYGLNIDACYFEGAASSGFPDIYLESTLEPAGTPPGQVPTRGVRIRDCFFGNPVSSQSCRVQSVGRSSFLAADNEVRLDDNQTFAHTSGLGVIWLHRNLIHHIGEGANPTYEDALILDESSSFVDIASHPASVGVSMPAG